MKNNKRILIAEDHAIIRDGLRSMLETIGGFDVIAEANDGVEAVEMTKKLKPDVLILDISLPKLSGLSVISHLRADHDKLKIIVLTVHDSDEYIRQAFSLGADGYCLKKGSFKELLGAVESVTENKIFVSPLITKQLISGYLKTGDDIEKNSSLNLLTKREKEVLKLVGEGYKSKEIGTLLYISPKTVDKHRSNIMTKLNIHNAASLTTYAIKKGLVNSKI